MDTLQKKLYPTFGVIWCLEFLYRHVFRIKIKAYIFGRQDASSSLGATVMATPKEMGQIGEGNLNLLSPYQ